MTPEDSLGKRKGKRRHIAKCLECGKEFKNYDAAPQSHCSVGCQAGNPPAMTRPPIEEFEKLLEAATPGPWFSDADYGVDGSVKHTCAEHTWYCVDSAESNISHDSTPEDSLLVVFARNNLPALIAYVKELEARCEQLHAKLAEERGGDD